MGIVSTLAYAIVIAMRRSSLKNCHRLAPAAPDRESESRETLSGEISAVSDAIRIDGTSEDAADRFARFRLIRWWDQERLVGARVVVIGAGALGNEILIHDRGGRFEIEDMDTADDTYVNGVASGGRFSSRGIRSFWARRCSSSHSEKQSERSPDRRPGGADADLVPVSQLR